MVQRNGDDRHWTELRQAGTLLEDSERGANSRIGSVNAKKHHFRNWVPVKTPSEFSGRFQLLSFPADPHICQVMDRKSVVVFSIWRFPSLNRFYQNYLNQYSRVLLQKNTLLKDLYRHPSLRPTIELWDLQLAKIGDHPHELPHGLPEKNSVYLPGGFTKGFPGKEEVQYQYRSTVFPEEIEGYTDASIEQYYQALCSGGRGQQTGFTSVGVHR